MLIRVLGRPIISLFVGSPCALDLLCIVFLTTAAICAVLARDLNICSPGAVAMSLSFCNVDAWGARLDGATER